MDSLTAQFLMACEQFVGVRRPLVEDLASALGVPPQELFHLWMEPRCPQSGTFAWMQSFRRVATRYEWYCPDTMDSSRWPVHSSHSASCETGSKHPIIDVDHVKGLAIELPH
jgi:hypothetical protein